MTHLRVVPENGKLKPLMIVESRPSRFTGIAYYLVLSYKDFHSERLLPPDFMGMDDIQRNLTVLPLAEQMRRDLAPILEAEDAKS